MIALLFLGLPGDPANWLTAIAACGALYWSWLTHQKAVVAEQRRLFFEVHRELITPEQLEAQRAIWGVALDAVWKNNIDQLSPEQFRAGERCLATFDVVALLAEQGAIDMDLLLQEWGWFFTNNAVPIELIINSREEQQGVSVWPHLKKAIAAAEMQAVEGLAPTD